MKVFVVSLALLLFVFPSVSQSGAASGVRVTKVAAAASHPVAFVYFDGAYNEPAACASTGSRMTIDVGTAQGQAQLSIAMQALATGTRVNLTGARVCGAVFDNVEVLSWIETI